MTPNEFLDLLAADEQRGVEFKNARARNDTNFPEVAKAVLGMANRRDGGWILVGVEDRTRNIEGLSDEQVASWVNPDPVREKLRQYADPDVWVDVEIVELDVDVSPVGARFGCDEGGRNEVDSDDGEALFREIRGVDALAAADVKRMSSRASLRYCAFEECGRLFAMPGQRLDCRRLPIEPCENCSM